MKNDLNLLEVASGLIEESNVPALIFYLLNGNVVMWQTESGSKEEKLRITTGILKHLFESCRKNGMTREELKKTICGSIDELEDLE
jgi:hypothetical protein